MKNLKHLFTALLLLCATAVAAHDFEVGGIYYNVLSETDKTVAVTFKGTTYSEYSDEYSGSVVIPESVTYNGSTYSVTSIEECAFGGCSSLASIEIPNSVTSIGTFAFGGCSSLASIEIPNSVTSIGNIAFSGCSGLTSITIPNSVTSIGNDAFENCIGLTSVEFNAEIMGSLYNSVFSGCNALSTVRIGENVKVIPRDAFYCCSSLTSVVIPNGVTSIGERAFYQCYRLTSVVIPNSVTSIGNNAFNVCLGLTSITSLIPAENLFAIYSGVFHELNKTSCTLYVPYGAKETYAATEGWKEFANIVEIIPTEVTVTINQYGSATYCSPYALDFSEVDGLKAYAATGYKSNSQVVTLTRVQTAEGGVGLFLKGEPGEYVVPVIESTDEHSLNMLVGTLESTIVNGTDGEMTNYKYTVKSGTNTPMFYQFADNSTLSAGKAYLQIPTAWLPATAQKSVSIRFDDGETTDIDELKGENGEVKTIYDLQGRVVENPTKGIYIVDGKKVFINK